MMITRAAGAVLSAVVLLTACTTGGDDEPGSTNELDLSTVRDAAWTVTAKEIAGSQGARMAPIGGFESITSVAAGNLVVSAAGSRTGFAAAGIDAESGEIAWRRSLPVDQDSFWSCEDDDGGTNLVCSVSGPDSKTAELSVIDLRTGKVRKTLEIDADESFAVAGDDLYLTTFTPADKERRLDVTAERRSWSTGRVAWRAETSFALDGGWGHDGGQGFEIGSSRVVAYSASWEVVLDKGTGRLLSRSESGRYEEPLAGGGWLIADSGDGAREQETITLFSSTGKPIAEDRLSGFFYDRGNIDERLVSTGRHLRDQSTGRSLFEAPKSQQIATVTDAGRVVLTEPAGAEHGEDGTLTYQVWDVETGQQRGTVDVPGEWEMDSVGGGPGVLLVSQRYDKKAEKVEPVTLYVIDARKPDIAATIDLGWTIDGLEIPSLVRTRAGAAVTGPTGVKGLVVRQ